MNYRHLWTEERNLRTLNLLAGVEVWTRLQKNVIQSGSPEEVDFFAGKGAFKVHLPNGHGTRQNILQQTH